MKYQLEIDEKQAELLIKALDVFSRIGMGQLHIVAEQLMLDPRIGDTTGEANAKAHELLGKMKKVLFDLERGAAYSITSHEMPDCYRQAFDLLQVIRHRISWDRNPQGGFGVWFDEPKKFSPDQPLAKISRIDPPPKRFHNLDEICEEISDGKNG